MALRIVEYAGSSDVGRQRESNEDALFLSPPLFAVADGMGGARAGEVASELATKAFEEHGESAEPPERQLTELAQAANSRIHDLASRDESLRGMGTTLTGAIVSDREVAIGHVGDSRAYRLRDGALEQLTRDHSLVAELERSGQISPEAAEHHPQKSIITRALGPEPDVEVDTYTVPARDGDVFLLTSDGLTGMVADDELAGILSKAPSLEEAAASLVRAANQNGGRDNITVVLFRLGAGEEGEDGGDEEPGAGETIAGQVTAEDVHAAGEPETTMSTASPRRRGARRPRPLPTPRRKRRLAPALLRGLVVLLLVGGIGTGLWALSRQVWFVGTDDAGLVALYRGVPYDLPFGIHLYTREYQSGVPSRAIPAARRTHVLNNEWRSRGDAVDLVRQLERGGLEVGP
jgi:PPM family protein phosphatase